MEIEIFNIVLDFTPLLRTTSQGFLAGFWYLFKNGAWVLFAFITITQGYRYWLIRQQTKWFRSHKFIMLAVDIPKDTEQTPKAVEQLFATVSGAHAPLNKLEIYMEGKFQLSFSFEIVSIDGYVQFLIRTPSQYRDVIESSIYSQYPDAEITEVDDYVDWAPEKYPDDNYNTWGTEIIPVAKEYLPFRTYPLFEDKVSGEYKDPLASLLETMSKIKVGEQVWLQILVKPTAFEWVKRSQEAAFKIAGKAAPQKVSRANKLIDWGLDKFDKTGEAIYPLWAEAKDKRDELPSMMLHLTPGEKNTIEAIENKASKMGFDCKIRLVYLSPKGQFAPARVVSSVFGSIKQFASLDLNSFYPDPKTKTTTNYWMTKYRNNVRRGKIVKNYKSRSGIRGHSYFILNTEELASLWHFPGREIRTPLLQRTETKKSEPPAALPIQPRGEEGDESVTDNLRAQLEQKPFDVDLDNDYYEEKFAKDKSQDKPKEKKIIAPTSKGQPPTNLPIE